VTITIDPARYDAAPRFPAYLESVTQHAEFWQGMYRTAVIPSEVVERMRANSDGMRLLVLSEDWCSDCFSAVPLIARLAEAAGVELRVLARDANPDLIDAHLTSGTRSIPVVMVLDSDHQVRAWCGPRPAALQRWYRNEPPSSARSRKKRAWYARDRGRTTLSELLETVERAVRRSGSSSAGREEASSSRA
jgi:thiol-disulfide isomerase/thioredoxin